MVMLVVMVNMKVALECDESDDCDCDGSRGDDVGGGYCVGDGAGDGMMIKVRIDDDCDGNVDNDMMMHACCGSIKRVYFRVWSIGLPSFQACTPIAPLELTSFALKTSSGCSASNCFRNSSEMQF